MPPFKLDSAVIPLHVNDQTSTFQQPIKKSEKIKAILNNASQTITELLARLLTVLINLAVHEFHCLEELRDLRCHKWWIVCVQET